MKLVKFLAAFKARQTRGGSWIQLILNIGIITANIKLFQESFESFGIPLTTMLVVGIFGYLFGTITLGYIDEKYGIWQHELEYNSNLNPFLRGIQKQLAELCKR